MLVHLDTDIGGDTDDACALAMLLGWPDVDLIAVTTSNEVNGFRAACARYLLQLARRPDLPVAAGAARSLSGVRPAPGLQSAEEYWRAALTPDPTERDESAAIDLLEASIEAGATIIAVGPLTNLAILERRRPGILLNARLVVMGGYLDPPAPGLPQWGPDMDYNVQSDVVAATIVLGDAEPTVVPFPVCFETTLRAADLPALRAAGPLGDLLAHQAELHARDNNMSQLAAANPALPPDLLNFHYDPIAAAVAAGWAGATVERLPLAIEVERRILTLTRDLDGKLTRIVTSVDADRFRSDWLQAIASASKGAPDQP